MTKIAETDYVIYTDEGPFINRPFHQNIGNIKALTTTYRGVEMHNETLINPLLEMKRLHSMGYQFSEIHCLASVTRGEHDKFGNPSGKHGQYIWTRVVAKDGKVGKWVYVGDNISPRAAARDCAIHVLSNLITNHRHNLRIALFGHDALARSL